MKILLAVLGVLMAMLGVLVWIGAREERRREQTGQADRVPAAEAAAKLQQAWADAHTVA